MAGCRRPARLRSRPAARQRISSAISNPMRTSRLSLISHGSTVDVWTA
jgi:hypothetical protein